MHLLHAWWVLAGALAVLVVGGRWGSSLTWLCIGPTVRAIQVCGPHCQAGVVAFARCPSAC